MNLITHLFINRCSRHAESSSVVRFGRASGSTIMLRLLFAVGFSYYDDASC